MKNCDCVETVSKFTYLGVRLNATGRCETAVTARSRIGLISSGNKAKYLKAEGFN